MNTKPPFPYFGGKQRIADKIVAAFPAHHHYVEPFCGGLSVLMAKPVSHMETVNDLDGDLMTFWRVLRDQPAELARVCALTPHARAEHHVARARENLTDLERARRIWVALTQGRAGQLVKTGWRYYIDGTASPTIGLPGYLDAYVDRMAAAAERLHHVTLECLPALDIITRYTAPSTLLYVDPPYVGSARGTTHSYQHEMRGEDQHRGLAEALQATSAAVVLSGYASPLYDALYDGWDRVEISAHTSQGNHSAMTPRRSRREVLWSNRAMYMNRTLEEASA